METNEATIISTMKLKTNTNERESGLELLRIIAMIFIIMHHITNIGIVGSSLEKSIRNIFLQNGKLGVNIFVLISAYFMVNKNLTIKHILKTILPTLFYSITLYLISIALKVDVFNFKIFTTYIFPVYFCKWWFVSCYIFLLFLTPLLNMFIKTLNKKKHTIVCIVLLILEVILPYFRLIITRNFEAYPFSNEIVLFCVLYFIGSYFRLYNIDVSSIVLLFISLFLFIIFKIFLPLFELKIEIYNLNSIGNMFLSISLFLLFNKIKIKSKFINKIASTTFGIYLIHEHPVFKSLLWGVVSDFISSYVSNIALIYVFAVLLVFLFCMLIDLVRQMTIHKLVLKMESRLLKNKNLA